MTAGDYLNSISTVTAVGAGIHLLNIETGATVGGQQYFAGELEFSVEPLEEYFDITTDEITFGKEEALSFDIYEEEVTFSIEPVELGFLVEECL